MQCFLGILIGMAAEFAANAALAAGGRVVFQMDRRDFYDDTTNVFLTVSSGVRLAAESGEWKRDANGTIYSIH